MQFPVIDDPYKHYFLTEIYSSRLLRYFDLKLKLIVENKIIIFCFVLPKAMKGKVKFYGILLSFPQYNATSPS